MRNSLLPNRTDIMKRIVVLPLVLLAGISGTLEIAWGQQDDGAKQQLQTLLANISTLSADVTQLIVESDGGVLEESSIKMRIKRPEGFYWETISPFPSLVITDGEKLWNYEPDLEQVVVEDWDVSRSELAAQLLNGDIESLSDDYFISILSNDRNGIWDFELIPQESNSLYQRIGLGFINDKMDTINVLSSNGQRTVWQFQNLLTNEPMADNSFSFQVPDGVEVIENTYVD